jgi:hypothetical protein
LTTTSASTRRTGSRPPAFDASARHHDERKHCAANDARPNGHQRPAASHKERGSDLGGMGTCAVGPRSFALLLSRIVRHRPWLGSLERPLLVHRTRTFNGSYWPTVHLVTLSSVSTQSGTALTRKADRSGWPRSGPNERVQLLAQAQLVHVGCNDALDTGWRLRENCIPNSRHLFPNTRLHQTSRK